MHGHDCGRENVRGYSSPQSLTVKRLAVDDDKGIERVVIAAPLPDPVVQGKRFQRNGTLSGILIYDPKVDERWAMLRMTRKALVPC